MTFPEKTTALDMRLLSPLLKSKNPQIGSLYVKLPLNLSLPIALISEGIGYSNHSFVKDFRLDLFNISIVNEVSSGSVSAKSNIIFLTKDEEEREDEEEKEDEDNDENDEEEKDDELILLMEDRDKLLNEEPLDEETDDVLDND
jgi:hypothetical protein